MLGGEEIERSPLKQQSKQLLQALPRKVLCVLNQSKSVSTGLIVAFAYVPALHH